MTVAKKYYYKGYECHAQHLPQRETWLCNVENVTHPFVFEVSREDLLQEKFEREVEDYINRCYDKGLEPKHSFMTAALKDHRAAIGDAMRKNHQQQQKKQQQKEREFQRSPWRYAVTATLVGIPALGYVMLASLGRVVPFTMFFPYRADVQSKRWPVLTLLVCVICWVVFTGQAISAARYEQDCTAFLELEASSEYARHFYSCRHLEYLRRSGDKNNDALQDIYTMYVDFETDYAYSTGVELNVDELLSESESNRILQQSLPLYELHVSPAFNDDVKYWPNRDVFLGSVTSMFAHADFEHILFNLIFFFAFAAAVERFAGYGFFLSLFAVAGLFNGLFHANSYIGSELALGLPLLGLSGMCTAFLGALLVLKHDVRIKTFFWFIFMVRTFLVPVWFLAAWYISFDVMNMLDDDDAGGVAYLVHVVGAFSGIGSAVFYKYVLQKKSNAEGLAT